MWNFLFSEISFDWNLLTIVKHWNITNTNNNNAICDHTFLKYNRVGLFATKCGNTVFYVVVIL